MLEDQWLKLKLQAGSRDAVKEMSFAAGPEMDRRLRRDIAKRQETSQTVGKPGGEKPIWRILMNTKIARLGVAAVVVVGAMAVDVERWTREEPKTVQAYSSEIRVNTALDLDPDAALPLREARPEDFDVTWSAENGGSLKILPGSSVRIWRIKLIDPSWDHVVSWTFEHLAEIQGSEATAVVAKKETPFAAVLTSEGNLAVVKIGAPEEERAWLSWRVEKAVIPSYSPTRTLTLRCGPARGPSRRLLPAAKIDELEEYAEAFGQDFQWIIENVEYVGAGRIGQDPPDTLIAYDKTLLAIGKGTYAVFSQRSWTVHRAQRTIRIWYTDRTLNPPPTEQKHAKPKRSRPSSSDSAFLLRGSTFAPLNPVE